MKMTRKAACLLLLSFAATAAQAEGQPNVIDILIDNWGWGSPRPITGHHRIKEC